MSTATVLARASRAEWTRIWTVRSSWGFLSLLGLAVLGLGIVAGVDVANNPGPLQPDDGTAWDVARFTSTFALFGTVAWAVVTATADHATGALVPTLQWTPRRGVLVAARAGVIAVTMTLVGVALVGLASAEVRAIVSGIGLPLDEGLESLGGLALVLLCGALLGIGLGLATRSTAVSIVIAVALLLVLPPITANLPFSWGPAVSERLPGSAALFLIFGNGPVEGMTATAARLTLIAWAVGAMALGGWRFVRSDASR